MSIYESKIDTERKSRWYQKMSTYEKLIITFFGGFIIMLLCVAVEIVGHERHWLLYSPNTKLYSKVLLHGMQEMGIALMSGAAVGIVLEIAGLLNFAKDTVIAALTSYKYLQSLTQEQIRKVKKDCNTMIWEKRGMSSDYGMTNSLMTLENELNDHLSNPYYISYDMEVDCTKHSLQKIFKDASLPNINVIKKVNKIKYVVHNPDGKFAEEKIEFNICFQKIENVDPSRLFNILKFTVSIDGEAPTDKRAEIKYSNVIDVKGSGKYDSSISIVANNDDIYRIPYKKSIEIEIEEERYIFEEDATFHRRLKRAARNVSLDYSLNDPSIHLFADCFVTTFKPKHTMKISSKPNNVRIDTNDEWLLPGNGFVVFHVPVLDQNITTTPPKSNLGNPPDNNSSTTEKALN